MDSKLHFWFKKLVCSFSSTTTQHITLSCQTEGMFLCVLDYFHEQSNFYLFMNNSLFHFASIKERLLKFLNHAVSKIRWIFNRIKEKFCRFSDLLSLIFKQKHIKKSYFLCLVTKSNIQKRFPFEWAKIIKKWCGKWTGPLPANWRQKIKRFACRYVEKIDYFEKFWAISYF